MYHKCTLLNPVSFFSAIAVAILAITGLKRKKLFICIFAILIGVCNFLLYYQPTPLNPKAEQFINESENNFEKLINGQRDLKSSLKFHQPLTETPYREGNIKQNISASELNNLKEAYDWFNRGISENDPRIKVSYNTKAIELVPQLYEANINRGAAYTDLDSNFAALSDYNQAISIDQSRYHAFYNRGNYYAGEAEYILALADFLQALNLDCPKVSAYFNIGSTFAYLDKYQESINYYSMAIEIDPNNAEVYYNRGLTYKKMEEYDSSIIDFREAISIDSNHVKALTDLGLRYYESGDYEESEKYYKLALEINDKYAPLLVNLGILYAYREDYETAIFFYSKATAKSNDPRIYHNRGNSYVGLEKYKLAIDDYDKALELNPDYSSALEKRSLAYMSDENYEDALRDLQQLRKNNLNNGFTSYWISVCYFELQDYSKAKIDALIALEQGATEAQAVLDSLSLQQF